MKGCKYFRQSLTDYYVRSLKSKSDMQITDTQIHGLHLRYSASTGRKIFYLSYTLKYTRRQRNIRLGSYTDFSIKDIRYRALKYRQMVSDGRDPMQELQDETKRKEIELRNRKTVSELLDEFWDKYIVINKKRSSQRSDKGIIENSIKPTLGKTFICELDLPKLIDFYNDIRKRTSASTANHHIALVSTFWNWCERYKYLPVNSNPCKLIEKGKNKKIEYAVLDEQGYRAFFNAVEQGINGQSKFNTRAFRAIKVIALTACRHSEITKLKKSELDLDNHRLNLEDSKTKAKKVPLSQLAIQELQKALEESPADSKYVFPALRQSTKVEESELDLRKPFAWVLQTAKLPYMRIHDLRHSFASFATDMGEDIHAIKEVLGHKYTTTTEIYTHMRDTRKIETANKVVNRIMFAQAA
ncbi:MAG: site-specific integrase [Alphaproteobacteria bacterium]|nr:site-specific integrase [Alphaproteobacteria bacterium]